MKNLLFAAALAFLIPAASFAQSGATSTPVKVWGNCGMCRKTIEKAAQIEGVSSAKWNTKTKMLSLTYDETKTTPQEVEQSIAKAGYDTEHFTADQKAYDNLHDCCKYDRK